MWVNYSYRGGARRIEAISEHIEEGIVEKLNQILVGRVLWEPLRLGLGLTVRYSAVGVGVNSACSMIV